MVMPMVMLLIVTNEIYASKENACMNARQYGGSRRSLLYC